mgnify:FL=1
MIQTSNLTVEFNSVHVNILSLLSDSLLFPIIMADNNVVGGGDENSVHFIHHLIRNSRRRRLMMQLMVHYLFARRRRLLSVCLISFLMLLSQRRVLTQLPRHRSCRRLLRNTGWWENVWNNYSEARFKKTFRISRASFRYILDRIEPILARQTVTEDPISPDKRLAICLYRLGRGDYFYTIAEMVGRGVSTVSSIVEEVSQVLVNHLWNDCVSIHFPDSTEAFKEKILDMEELWQFPCCWAAIDGCHIPIKCPPGGLESCKEFHNFKNFYSIILMAMVDSKNRFVWGSCGFPGNSHDAIIFKSTNLWDALQNGLLPNIAKVVGEVSISSLIVGDSAFPLQLWLMKPYTNATLSPKQSYFNYRLSRARMVTESAYGQLKGRWRVLFRKNESNKERVRTVTLACMVLHNICIESGDSIARKLDQWIQAPRKRGIVKRLGSFYK